MPTKKASYKICFSPAMTVDDINATLDAVDKARFNPPDAT